MFFSIEPNVFYALSWTIIHSLWQGGLVFAVLSIFFYTRPRLSSAQKFNASYAGLLVFFGMVLFTFWQLNQAPINTTGEPAFTAWRQWSFSADPTNGWNVNQLINANSAYIANAWFIGFALFLMRYLLSYGWLLYQVSKAKEYLIPELDLGGMLASMNISKKVTIKSCSLHGGPFTMGLFKSAIFFPIAALNQLNAQEIEAIVAHELAHIRRNDFVLNLIAAAIETMLYYHPVIWWLQKQLAQNREEACDDEALAYIQNPMVYARALLKIQELENNHNAPELSLAFTGKKSNQLLNRIKRIFQMSHSPIQLKEKLMASLVLIIVAMGLTEAYAYRHENGKHSLIKALESKLAEKRIEVFIDSIPAGKKKQSISIIKSDGEKEISLKMENGAIKSLVIDGVEVPPSEFDKHKELIKEITPDEDGDLKTYSFSFSDKDFDFMPLHGEHFKNFSFDFPDDMHVFKLDSLHQLHQLKADSMMKLADIFRFKADSLHGFQFMMPEMNGQTFKFHFPEDGMHWQGLENLDIPEIDGWPEAESPEFFGIHPNDDHAMMEKRFFKGGNDRNLEQLIGSQLNRDGFLIAGKKNKIELSGKNLKINGEKQPSNIWNKYKDLFEQETGMPLSKDTKLVFEIEGKTSNRKFKSF